MMTWGKPVAVEVVRIAWILTCFVVKLTGYADGFILRVKGMKADWKVLV